MNTEDIRMDNVIVGILIFICVVTGIWGWWMENGPEKKNAKDEALPEERTEEKNTDQTDKTSD